MWSFPVGWTPENTRFFVRSELVIVREVHERRAALREHDSSSEKPALTYFRVATIIGPACLTAVFGMVTGVSRQVKAPAMVFASGPAEDRGRLRPRIQGSRTPGSGKKKTGVRRKRGSLSENEVKPIDWLVPVG